MKAFFIANISEMKNPEKFQEYGQKAGKTLQPFGGELIIRGKRHAVLTGNSTSVACGVIGFPSLQKLEAWYASAEYQAIVPLREEAVTMHITAYEVPA